MELRNPNTPKRRKIKQQWLALGWTEDDMADAWGLTGMTGLVAALELYWVGTKAQLLEPHRNIELCARWVKVLLRKYGNYPQALAAYNGGQGTARSYPDCGFPCRTYAPEVWNRALYWKKLTETKR
jgi:soluble lytic murein transglycosylase-like protein